MLITHTFYIKVYIVVVHAITVCTLSSHLIYHGTETSETLYDWSISLSPLWCHVTCNCLLALKKNVIEVGGYFLQHHYGHFIESFENSNVSGPCERDEFAGVIRTFQHAPNHWSALYICAKQEGKVLECVLECVVCRVQTFLHAIVYSYHQFMYWLLLKLFKIFYNFYILIWKSTL